MNRLNRENEIKTKPMIVFQASPEHLKKVKEEILEKRKSYNWWEISKINPECMW